jgi:hypothetical protein
MCDTILVISIIRCIFKINLEKLTLSLEVWLYYVSTAARIMRCIESSVQSQVMDFLPPVTSCSLNKLITTSHDQ